MAFSNIGNISEAINGEEVERSKIEQFEQDPVFREHVKKHGGRHHIISVHEAIPEQPTEQILKPQEIIFSSEVYAPIKISDIAVCDCGEMFEKHQDSKEGEGSSKTYSIGKMEHLTNINYNRGTVPLQNGSYSKFNSQQSGGAYQR